ncbi:MAG: hypothetical protein U1E27_11640 [Kiritimatiellia bacterium]|nr:hypothetical protein [Kiritimatiellia bacterium]
MKNSIRIRYSIFILASALAGFLSGFMIPHVFGVRGAILGTLISVGALVLNPHRRRNGAVEISARKACATAAVVAVVAWSLIVAWDVVLPQGGQMDMSLALTDFRLLFAALGNCLSYALCLLMGYRAHQSGSGRAWRWFVVAPLSGAAIRAVAIGEILGFPYSLICGAIPFVFLWITAVRLTDPGWSERRWRRVTRQPGEA